MQTKTRFNEIEVNLETAKRRLYEVSRLITGIVNDIRPNEPEDETADIIEELEHQKKQMKKMIGKLESHIQSLNMMKYEI